MGAAVHAQAPRQGPTARPRHPSEHRLLADAERPVTTGLRPREWTCGGLLVSVDQVVRGWRDAATASGISIAHLRRKVDQGLLQVEKDLAGTCVFQLRDLEALRHQGGEGLSLPTLRPPSCPQLHPQVRANDAAALNGDAA